MGDSGMPVHKGFNPRPPCGERPLSHISGLSQKKFQSTPPVWGATLAIINCKPADRFQSTPPVWGATLSARQAGSSE